MTEPLDGLRFAPRHCGKAGLRSEKARDSVWDPWCEKAVFRFGIPSLESPGIGFEPLVWNSTASIWDLTSGKSGIRFRTFLVEKQCFDLGSLVWKVRESVSGLWCGTAEFRSGTLSLGSPGFLSDPWCGKEGLRPRTLDVKQFGAGQSLLV